MWLEYHKFRIIVIVLLLRKYTYTFSLSPKQSLLNPRHKCHRSVITNSILIGGGCLTIGIMNIINKQLKKKNLCHLGKKISE